MSSRVQAMLPNALPQERTRQQQAVSILPLLLFFGVLRLLLQTGLTLLSVHAGYGIFRDELYYLVCGRRLAAGYVDQPPLVALQARLSELLFGYQHLVAFRLLPAIAGALMVVLTGLLATALGGSRRAAGLAMLSVLSVPVFLATQSFLSMNAWDPVFWMAAALAMTHLVRQPDKPFRWWLLLGASVGLASENKASVVFFAAALLLALAATSARRLLLTRGFLLAVGVALLIALPNLAWQLAHGFPTLEWLRDVSHSSKVTLLSPPRFLLAQVLMLSPLHLLFWAPGVMWLLVAARAKRWRFAGWLYVFFFAIMLALHAKDYYLAPIYPLYFAAGAVFWTEWAARPAVWLQMSSRVRWGLLGAYMTVMTLLMAVAVPFAMPVLSPAAFVRYAQLVHFQPIESEQHSPTPLPEFFADHLGWQQLTDKVSRVYHALPVAEQRQTGILTANYGQASAITILGGPLGLPPAISGHQNFWLWGPNGYTGKEMIVVTTTSPEEMRDRYRSCSLEARQDSLYAMPWEQWSIYLCHDRLQSLSSGWRSMKLYF